MITRGYFLEYIRDCWKRANKITNHRLRYPSVHWFRKSTDAGYAIGSSFIAFNLTLAKENPETFIKEIIPHEIAHCFIFYDYPELNSHSMKWGRLCVKLGGKHCAYHDMDITHCEGK